MKIGRLLVGLSALGVWAGATVAEATTPAPMPSQPSVQTTAYEFTDFFAQETAEETVIGDSDLGCGGCGTNCDSGCTSNTPWALPQPCLFQNLGIMMGGWVQQGVTFNSTNPSDGFNGPNSISDLANNYQLNQAWLYFIRPTDTGGHGFDIGGRVDLVYGTDWRYGKTLGLEDNINSPNNLYGLTIPQFYMEAAVNNLTVRMGHYAINFGYEIVPSVGNFFYSHNHALGAGGPLLATGVQADYRLGDQLLLTGGMNRGWHMFEDMNHHYDFLGGFVWNSCDKKSMIKFNVTTGPQDPAGQNNRFAYALTGTRQLGQKTSYAIEHVLGDEQNANPRSGGDAQWYSLTQWLTYQINPCWSAGARFEWFRDAQGSRIAGVGNWIGSDKGSLLAPGFAGDFYDMSVGLNWRPRANILVRPELRYDWYNGTSNLAGDRPFGGGDLDNQLTAAADLIITF